MNELINRVDIPTMSSLEIANLCEKQHKNVIADIKQMFAHLEISSAEFSAQYKDSTGRSLPCYNLDKELTLTLVAGYNTKLRYRIIKRWQDLESANSPHRLPQTYLEAMEELVIYIKKSTQLENKVQEYTPKVEHFDAAMSSQDLVDMREVAIILNCGLGRNRIFEILRHQHWLDIDNKSYQSKVSAGYFKSNEIIYQCPKNGGNKVRLKTMVTQKGLDAIRKLIRRVR